MDRTHIRHWLTSLRQKGREQFVQWCEKGGYRGVMAAWSSASFTGLSRSAAGLLVAARWGWCYRPLNWSARVVDPLSDVELITGSSVFCPESPAPEPDIVWAKGLGDRLGRRRGYENHQPARTRLA